jgi:hypothetical protein
VEDRLCSEECEDDDEEAEELEDRLRQEAQKLVEWATDIKVESTGRLLSCRLEWCTMLNQTNRMTRQGWRTARRAPGAPRSASTLKVLFLLFPPARRWSSNQQRRNVTCRDSV